MKIKFLIGLGFCALTGSTPLSVYAQSSQVMEMLYRMDQKLDRIEAGLNELKGGTSQQPVPATYTLVSSVPIECTDLLHHSLGRPHVNLDDALTYAKQCRQQVRPGPTCRLTETTFDQYCFGRLKAYVVGSGDLRQEDAQKLNEACKKTTWTCY